MMKLVIMICLVGAIASTEMADSPQVKYFGQTGQMEQQPQQEEEEEGLEEGEGEVPPQFAQGGPQDPRLLPPPQQGRYPVPPPPPEAAALRKSPFEEPPRPENNGGILEYPFVFK